MDEQVLRSLIKWPNVPDCYGWLALDRRGQWRMRDEFAQQHQLPGQVINHQGLKEFIARNYTSDGQGRFFFQNGPQRVFITLDATPWIVRINSNNEGLQFTTQCHNTIEPRAAFSDELGNIYIAGSIDPAPYKEQDASSFTYGDHMSVALLHDHDLDQFSELAKLHQAACSFAGTWTWQEKQLPLDPIHSDELAGRFHFIPKPSNQSSV
ncbi:DUF2946 family protein [Polynucleobacter sp. MWH-Svant-W18]|uniref:DUF2946 family protein n=1 Tax=Polynucleobacter sp. MWH-Svant-W18 TaxID=1855909 RepID=UPI001BFDEBDA|nr:DUF2946 family protein [Polynucleobacter sp. MWH-Svant-W18]QWD77727.1 DUF2946 family protein [Polynucleobacter sp. MWH-Svant-W18]